MEQRKKLNMQISGMHCASCEVLIERKLQKIPGVNKVKVNHATGRAEIYCADAPKIEDLQAAIQADGYTIHPVETHTSEPKPISEDSAQTGAIFLLILAIYIVLSRFNLFPEGLAISDNMSYGFIFAIGLVAAVSSCIAVTGGLLVAAAAKYSELHPNLSGIRKFKPHLYFNAGRVIGYTVFGGLVGALGSILTLSTEATGWLTVLVSIVMILLGFQMLHIFPALRRFQPKMPKFLSHKIHDLTGSDHPSVPFVLGAGTFFLPCGFTQALQLYVLSTGDMLTGALTMLVFSLGTLPSLMSLGAISSFAKGNFQKIFLKVAGILIVMIGIFNINNGLVLAGADVRTWLSPSRSAGTLQEDAQVAELVDGKQIVRMKVDGYDYYPSRFVVKQGIPVEWRIDGTGAAGCAQVLVAQKIGLQKYITEGENIVTFTPTETGNIPFSCSMGMTTPGAGFTVVPN